MPRSEHGQHAPFNGQYRSLLLSPCLQARCYGKKNWQRRCPLGPLQAVGVFVDESADVIARTCEEAELDMAQLHGAGAREALPALPHSLEVIYVMHADSSGRLHTAAPASPAVAASPDLDHYQGRCFTLSLMQGSIALKQAVAESCAESRLMRAMIVPRVDQRSVLCAALHYVT